MQYGEQRDLGLGEQSPLTAMAVDAHEGNRKLSVQTAPPPVTPHPYSPLLLEGRHQHTVPPGLGYLLATSSPHVTSMPPMKGTWPASWNPCPCFTGKNTNAAAGLPSASRVPGT